MINENFIYVGIVLNLLGRVSYIVATFKGKTKPNRVSWFLWGVIPLIAFVAERQEGAGLVSLMTLAIAIESFIIFLLTFIAKKSQWELTRFDYICGALSVIGIILWIITKIGNIAILFSIFADATAGTPTVVKSFKAPETENSFAFLTTAIGALITMLTIKTWNFANYAYPIYVFLMCSLIYSLIQFKLGKKTGA